MRVEVHVREARLHPRIIEARRRDGSVARGVSWEKPVEPTEPVTITEHFDPDPPGPYDIHLPPLDWVDRAVVALSGMGLLGSMLLIRAAIRWVLS